MHRRPKATGRADTASIPVIVYDGLWRCCGDAAGPPVDQTSWLVVAKAARTGTGFVYRQDWSGRSVPYLMAPPGP